MAGRGARAGVVMAIIYHITTWDDWQSAQAEGEYRAGSLATQGFIHFSMRDQVCRVADAVYRGQAGLCLLCVDEARLSAPLKYEPPDTTVPAEHRDMELFPHLYGALNLSAVVAVVALPPGADGAFSLPPGAP